MLRIRYFKPEELNDHDIYLHYGVSGLLRATKLAFDRGHWWTEEPIQYKATSIPMIKWEDVRNWYVKYGPINGKIKIVLPMNDFDNSLYCHCMWEQAFDERGKLILPCGFVKLSKLKFL